MVTPARDADTAGSALVDRLRRVLGDAVTGVEELPGGISSLTYRAEVGGRPVVVKVAPAGRRPVANRDVLRQARLFAALDQRGGDAPPVLAPIVVATDDGDPPLFVMDLLPGHTFEPATDTVDEPPGPAEARERVLAAARHLVAVQSVTPDLEDLASEPVIGLAAEIGRWHRLMTTADDPELIAEADRLADALHAGRPSDGPPVLAHGDYRLGNLLFEGSRLRGVIDWEIWSWGDGRLDLAWLIEQAHALHRQTLTAPDPAHRRIMEAMPSADDVVAAYREAGGEEPADLAWFRAVADFKIGATLAVLIKQNRRRPDPDPVLESRAAGIPPTLARARQHLGLDR